VSIFKWLKGLWSREKCGLCQGPLGNDWDHMWFSSVDENGLDEIYKIKICKECVDIMPKVIPNE